LDSGVGCHAATDDKILVVSHSDVIAPLNPLDDDSPRRAFRQPGSRPAPWLHDVSRCSFNRLRLTLEHLSSRRTFLCGRERDQCQAERPGNLLRTGDG